MRTLTCGFVRPVPSRRSGIMPLFGRRLTAAFDCGAFCTFWPQKVVTPRSSPAGHSYLLMAKGSTKTIRMSLSREQPPARVERAQQEQDYAASRSGHAGCRLFFLRCKRECGGLKPLPGAIVGFCVSCLFRTHPSRHVPRRTTPAWQKRRSERCGLKARAEGTVCLQTRE